MRNPKQDEENYSSLRFLSALSALEPGLYSNSTAGKDRDDNATKLSTV
jgi:hypothetical protein